MTFESFSRELYDVGRKLISITGHEILARIFWHPCIYQ
jgi:hypothetical protein